MTTQDIDRPALMFIGAVSADRRQADHLMQLVAHTAKDGCIEVDEETVDGLMGLTKHGLRAGRIVTPVETIFETKDGRVRLTSLGTSMLRDFCDGEEL